MADTEALARLVLDALYGEGPAQETSAESNADCAVTLLPQAWCSHCTEARLPNDPAWCEYHTAWDQCHMIPTIHDGRHGRTCTRCTANDRKERNAIRVRL